MSKKKKFKILSLFEYISSSDLNIIILAAIFHYYFVFIHPFSDGNGRCARFWVTLMLINYDKNFEFIPLEEEIYLNQENYYLAVAECHNNGNANVFIKFILQTINSSLDKLIKNSNLVCLKVFLRFCAKKYNCSYEFLSDFLLFNKKIEYKKTDFYTLKEFKKVY